jgi:hypothetical protein
MTAAGRPRGDGPLVRSARLEPRVRGLPQATLARGQVADSRSLLALQVLAFFPVIGGKRERTYERVSGASWDGYLARSRSGSSS